jgi:heme A synthase
VLTILSGLNLPLTIAHSVCAAALLATGMHLLIRVKAAPA